MGHTSEEMGRKGKTQKHTAAEIAGKHKAAKEAAGAAGGGKSGKADREAKKAAGNLKCTICMAQQPNIQSMERHYDSKHSKINWNDEKAKYEKRFVDQRFIPTSVTSRTSTGFCLYF